MGRSVIFPSEYFCQRFKVFNRYVLAVVRVLLVGSFCLICV